MNVKKEILFSDMEEIFFPKNVMSDKYLKSSWRVIDIGTSEYKGKTLVSMKNSSPEDLTFSPKLTGWYKIYLDIPFMFADVCPTVAVKLSSDDSFTRISASPHGLSPVRWMTMHECLWKCADLTGEDIILSKKSANIENIAALSAIRLIEMTEQEISEYKKECDRTETRNIYATDDLHNMFYLCDRLDSYDDFRPMVSAYRNSDVEWLSVENVRPIIADNLSEDIIDDVDFMRAGDKRVQTRFPKWDLGDLLKKIVEYGHNDGLKMSISLRMGAWGMLAPYDGYYFDSPFVENNPELCCVDRNGDKIPAMSYAYPKVRKYIINELLFMAESGCDAVTLMSNRGIPYVLFEKPVADRFYEMYGEYPYELPLDDERLNSLHCEIMTEFMREARAALDERFGKDKVKLHFRAMFSIYDSKYLGFDVERYAAEGLVDTFISYPMRCYEAFNGDVWQDGKQYRLDLDKYTTHMRTKIRSIARISDFDFQAPYTDYKGILRGPSTQKERVEEWMTLCEKYGTKVYFDIMPRHMANAEFKRRILELYSYGAENIGLWDTNTRVEYRAMWSTVRNIGHKDRLADMYVGEGENYRNFVIYSIGGKDFSRYDPVWGG
ncbi:MAG: hypothetical protein IJZ03_05315 [Clostridia bacterium]|nr:hypothetical protein [Clostridia bacterium]MBQ9749070.1 hypothetical protein [Clostridia bacterium]